eukprot:CAMPEP_0119123964 /NCGR_PEP_ID=MMETSP1310-20130426/3723_1 /TAXON_ID=464262 /ORGANISM="Genus nov. species nov., Strain RCC2339" /LENGTH=172 /DNA_ID=CAMNT_0007113839 /DNA_START=53 /DNA_END=568 /DNA_ORIENTATION=-
MEGYGFEVVAWSGSVQVKERQEILELLEECFPPPGGEEYHHSDTKWRDLFGTFDEEDCFVGSLRTEKDQLVGVVMGAIFVGLEKVRQVTIFNLGVHPLHRGRGLGGRLLRAAALHARRLNCVAVVGNVQMGSPGTERLFDIYGKMGAAKTTEVACGSSGPTQQRVRIDIGDW